ncbi:GSCFA domain-containing protein [Arenibacter sp. GZD96]|uniref:GSCFA domain-containing protein n=1 Tax=Aurantibrevibacter litoralis TaxID=3106030 RepID=UPI002AFF4FEE|nr:GSCFA domain-containing protein [Arenibacter sp. GZD-96]MEA1785796.1 GSCFA domain-containing protein [Arenibacter sp. GZD-96]
MKLQTQVPLMPSKNRIDYTSRLLVLGSCFATHIGAKLRYYKFQSVQNPFGILFHPKAIERLILRAIQREPYTENDLFFRNEQWHCFDAHSDMSDTHKERLLENLNTQLQHTFQQCATATHIVISIGTAWVYRHKAFNQWVANCHKVPQSEFTKELLNIEEIENSISRIIEAIRNMNPAVHFIGTVSPVRHLKDGFVENQRSKAHIISALHHIVQQAHFSEVVSYFESYEIMMDELRDYRFYAEDMVHPNRLAVAYIWEKFKKSWISEPSYPIMEVVDGIQKGLNHRPFHAESEAYQTFKKGIAQKISNLKEDYPFMDFQGSGM